MVGQLRPVKIESQKLWFSLSTSTAGGPVRFLRIPGTRRAKGNSKDERRGVADDDNDDIVGLRPPPAGNGRTWDSQVHLRSSVLDFKFDKSSTKVR